MLLLLAGFAPDGSATLVTASGYFDFILKLVLALGVAFVLPVFVVLLNFVGVLPGRAILRGWRIAVLVVVAFTALATPIDPHVRKCAGSLIGTRHVAPRRFGGVSCP